MFAKLVLLSIIVLTGLLSVSCEELLPSQPAEAEVLDGPMDGLTPTQLRTFLHGDEAFAETFTPATGLGPYYVTASCISCHAGDGKGHPFTTLTRFGKYGNGGFDPLLNQGGPQWQNRAIPGYEAEVIPAEATGITRFTPPAVTGLGFLGAISDAALLALADPNDADGDGISGEVNYLMPPDFFTPTSFHIPNAEGRYIGRFGKKSGAIDLLHQTVNAYKEDMGITSDFDMEDPINHAVADSQIDFVPDPEIPAATIHNVVFYLRTLKAPLPRNQDDPEVQAGKEIFMNIQCDGCHISTLKTGPSDIEVLSEKEFHPYTDLLMHDMGPALDDGYIEGSAQPNEWRTPPLWGLGLSPYAQGGSYYLMHDGRANSIGEAILLHEGEAASSREMYQALEESEQQKLIKFLESL
jgi:CxxC motif-containing protein (DUF1111 family)